MILVDRKLAEREEQCRPIRVGLLGAGFMARGLVNQIANSVPGMRVTAIANRTVQRAADIAGEAGLTPISATAERLAAGVADSEVLVTDDPELLCRADGIDCIVDATGAIEYGAQVTLEAFASGKPVVSMNAELEGTVGAILQQRANAAGVLFTLCDGDQPGVQMNLYRFVRGIGLTPLVCGNIKGLQDPYRTPATQKAFAERWGQNPTMVTSFADGTKISFEQACVANATGLSIERRGMRGADVDGHVDELCAEYDVEQLRALGGVVDYVVGTRPAPGVYVLATHNDPKQRHYLALYKLGDGPLYSFYVPYHLCHFEVPLSIARAVDFGDAVLQARRTAPSVDVVATAKQDLRAGQRIDGLGGFDTYGQCETHARTRDAGLLPIGLAEGCVLKRDVRKDQVLTHADVERPAGRLIDRLRTEQDAVFTG
ncbi:SAF domain-containing protein [uncultured Abyssibacter sp.]|uniref:NAD(P)H-dependent oxidoreductase n=1 Tax=uncultured Abyssibacter sp. TaxID=2320202 RepID=UPI0032B10A1A